MSSLFKCFDRSLLGVSVICASLGVAGTAFAQQTGQPNQVATTTPAPAANRALTATEQAAVVSMLNQINSLSGVALQAEVERQAKLYSDQNLNLVGIVKAVKTASGNKLGAVNRAMASACGASAPGSAAASSICEAAAVSPDDGGGASRRDVASLPGTGTDTGGIETAGLGGAGGAGAGLGGLTGGTGTGTGNGSGSTGNTGPTTGSGGAQTYSSFATTTSSGGGGGVGKSVSNR